MSDLKELVDRFVTMWNTADTDARHAAVADLWAEDGVYVDPLKDDQGHEAIRAGIDVALERFGGNDIKLLSDVDVHHNVARYRWGLVPPAGGESVVEGVDVVVVEEGRFKAVYGFIDKMPAI